jgi:PKD repeat protein
MFAPCFNITDPGNQKVFTNNADMLLLKPALLSLVFNGTQSTKVKFFKNSNALTTSTLNSIPNALPNSTATLKIGKYGGIATRYYQGDIGEILIYNNELGAADKYLVDTYLRFKYAPPVTLGPDTLMAANSVCTNIILKAQSVYQNYIWSTGATTSSITVSSPGTYWVTVTDFLGNVSSDSIVVFPPFTMNLPSSGALCENTSIVWAPSYPTAAFSYLWQNGSTSPSFTITQSGSYFVKITDGSGCFIKSDTLVVTIDNYSSTATLGPDANLCSGNVLALQTGAGTTVSYLWNGSSSPGQPSSYQVNNSGTYFVESTNINGCVAQDTINVTVVGVAPIANFSTANVCDGFAAAFDDNSVPAGAAPIDGWQWDFGDNQTSIQQNPIHLYSSPGTYPVELYVSQGICGAYFYDTIEVYSNPNVNFGYTGHCQGETIQFTNSSVAGSAPITNYYWDFGMPQSGAYNNSTIPIPNRIFDDSGSYNVEFIITDANGCKDSITQILVIDPTPQVELIVANSCQNQEANIVNATPSENGLIYNWNFGDNSSSILPNPVKVYPLYGIYLVTLEVSNAFGCTGIQSSSITINPEPTAIMDIGPACVGSFGSLTDVSNGNIASSIWVVNATDSLFGSPSEYLWSNSGQQQIELTTFTDAGCSSTSSVFIDIIDTLDAAFLIGSNIVAAGDPLDFNNITQGEAVFLWNFGDGTLVSEFSTQHTYSNSYVDSTVNVMLIALNNSGCIDSAIQSLTVLEPLVDISLDQLFLDEESGWYTVGVLITNNGTSNVVSIPFSLETEKGALFNETFSGLLYPTKDTIYVFNGKPPAISAIEDVEQAFVCVSGIANSITGLTETLLSDNGICENLKDYSVSLIPLSPNPASSEVNVSILVSEDSNLSIDLLDAQGRLISTILPFQLLSSGTYNYLLNIRELSSGSYFIRLKTENENLMEKLLIQQ